MRCHLIIEDDPVIPGKLKIQTLNILAAAEIQVAIEMGIDPLSMATPASQTVADIAKQIEEQLCQ